MLQLIRQILGENGDFAALCPDYEHRDEQIEMAVSVADSLMQKHHLLVEAGTGVGKTVAYLVPAVLFASGNKPVIISTHTIALQSQLVTKDIPLIKSVLKDYPFNSVLMKGRSNYLCLNELDHASASLLYQGDKPFDDVKKWASETTSGDVQDMPLIFSDWYEICCNPDTCRRQECKYYSERCFYYGMRRKAEKADIVVVNHSLFFSDLGMKMSDAKSAVLPDYSAVIFDEAHHLEDVASDIFGIEFSNYRVTSLLNRLKKRKEIAVSNGEYQLIETANKILFESFSRINKQDYFFDELYETVDKISVEEAAADLIQMLDSLNTQLQGQDTKDNKELKERLDGYRRMLLRMRDELSDLFFTVQPNYFRWAEQPANSKFVNCCLHFSPVNVSEIMQNFLWKSPEPVVCTSATLSNSGTFSYIKGRLGISECEEHIMGSPFDYKHQALIYVPDDLEIPSEKREYADALAEKIKELIIAAKRQSLFTLYFL